MTRVPVDHTLWRGRVATSLLFALYGTILGVWTVRIPAIKEGLGLSDGQLSIGLLAFAAGAITGMQAIGRPVDRLGSRRIMIAAVLADGAALLLPAYARSLWILVLSLFVFGAVHGTLNIAMNANAVEVQRAWHRPIMSSFHAVYSVGGFLGAAVGGIFARAGLPATTTFVTVAAVVLPMALWARHWAFNPDVVRVEAAPPPDPVTPSRLVRCGAPRRPRLLLPRGRGRGSRLECRLPA